MKKNKIFPAILEKEFLEIEKKIKKIKKNFNSVQIDICDGEFVPSKTFASSKRKDSFLKIKKVTKNLNLELDMMVKKPEKWLTLVKLSNAARVVFHKKTVRDFSEIFLFSKNEKINVGLGVHLDDKNSEILKILQENNFKFIQIMGIKKVGYSGEKLSEDVYKKIKFFRKNFPKLEITIDGGVKEENYLKLIKAGASKVGANSMIFKDKTKKLLI